MSESESVRDLEWADRYEIENIELDVQVELVSNDELSPESGSLENANTCTFGLYEYSKDIPTNEDIALMFGTHIEDVRDKGQFSEVIEELREERVMGSARGTPEWRIHAKVFGTDGEGVWTYVEDQNVDVEISIDEVVIETDTFQFSFEPGDFNYYNKHTGPCGCCVDKGGFEIWGSNGWVVGWPEAMW